MRALLVRAYLSPEPLLQSPSYVATMAGSGMSVPAYAYAANNPVRFTDSDGLRIRLMDQAARSVAFGMSLNPQMKYLYDWLDNSPTDYEMWGDAILAPSGRRGTSREGHFSAGELSGTNMCNARGGTVRLDPQGIKKTLSSRRAVAAHEIAHAGIFDYQTGPRPFAPDGMAVPPVIEMFLEGATPKGLPEVRRACARAATPAACGPLSRKSGSRSR